MKTNSAGIRSESGPLPQLMRLELRTMSYKHLVDGPRTVILNTLGLIRMLFVKHRKKFIFFELPFITNYLLFIINVFTVSLYYFLGAFTHSFYVFVQFGLYNSRGIILPQFNNTSDSQIG